MGSFIYFLFAVASNSNSGKLDITGADIAALVTAIGGIIVGVFAAYRRSKSDRERLDSDEHSAIYGAYTKIVQTLQDEVTRLRSSYNNERKEWLEERNLLEKENDQLKDEIIDLRRQLKERPSRRQHQSNEEKPQ